MTHASTTSPDPALANVSAGPRQLSVLLFSHDARVREQVRLAVGRRPAPSLEVSSWTECATADAVVQVMRGAQFDVLILDGEAQPLGGLGLSKQLHAELKICPPVVVLIGRAADGWLAAWSECDDVVVHPVDPEQITQALVRAVTPKD